MRRAADNKIKEEQPTLRIFPWRDRPRLPVDEAAEVYGGSPAALYQHAHAGKLKFVRQQGRTFVDTASLIKLIEAAETWTPSRHGEAGRAKQAANRAAKREG
jgi:hypothetical protein